MIGRRARKMRVSGIGPVSTRRARIKVGQTRQRLGQDPPLDVRVAVGGELERLVPKYPLNDLQWEALRREPRPGRVAEAVEYQLEAVLVVRREPGRDQVGAYTWLPQASANRWGRSNRSNRQENRTQGVGTPFPMGAVLLDPLAAPNTVQSPTGLPKGAE